MTAQRCEACGQVGLPVRRVGSPSTGDEDALVCEDARACQRNVVVEKRGGEAFEREVFRRRVDAALRVIPRESEAGGQGERERER